MKRTLIFCLLISLTQLSMGDTSNNFVETTGSVGEVYFSNSGDGYLLIYWDYSSTGFSVIIFGAIEQQFSTTANTHTVSLKEGETIHVNIYSGGYLYATGSYTYSSIPALGCSKPIGDAVITGTYARLPNAGPMQWKLEIKHTPYGSFGHSAFLVNCKDEYGSNIASGNIGGDGSIVLTGYEVKIIDVELIPTDYCYHLSRESFNPGNHYLKATIHLKPNSTETVVMEEINMHGH